MESNNQNNHGTIAKNNTLPFWKKIARTNSIKIAIIEAQPSKTQFILLDFDFTINLSLPITKTYLKSNLN